MDELADAVVVDVPLRGEHSVPRRAERIRAV